MSHTKHRAERDLKRDPAKYDDDETLEQTIRAAAELTRQRADDPTDPAVPVYQCDGVGRGES